jgi:signal transduction histidine kinase/CheY-like chemotaxis protein
VTESLVLFQGPRGIVAYFPVLRAGRIIGYVNSVFDCQQLVRDSLREGVLDRYHLRVTDEAGTLFESPAFGQAAAPTGRASASVGGHAWRIAVVPNAALRAASHPRAADLLLVLAVVLGGTVWVLSRSWVERRRSAALLAAEKLKLEHHVAESQKLEAIGRLAGGVAHDFNNLLTAMIGHAQMVREEAGLSDQLKEDLGVIIDAGHRAALITRDLLTFSRKEVVRSRSIDAAKEVARLRPMLEHLLREDVRLVLELDAEAGWIWMDPTQLERALMNLVVNAVDAQPRGGQIRIVVNRQGDGRICVAVSDDGDGMPPDVAARAFEPFFTTKPAGKGTGLGLASVYGIARQAGGEAALSTRAGVGTTISLLLPATTAVAQEHGEPRHELPVAPARNCVLVVEDDASVRELGKRILEQAKYEVIVAGDAAEALKRVGSGVVPDILLTDEVMPGSRGHDLARELRAKFPRLRVLVCSGHAEEFIDDVQIEALQASFLQKPFTPTQLLQALADLRAPTAPS